LTVPSTATITIEGEPRTTPDVGPAASPVPTVLSEMREVPPAHPAQDEPRPLQTGPVLEHSSPNEPADAHAPLTVPPSPVTPLEPQPADEAPIQPIAAPSDDALARLEAASFNGVTPGETLLADVEKAWGQPKEIKKHDGVLAHTYSVAPFDRVEVTFFNDKVSAVIIRLGKGFPAEGVAKQLELTDVRPVLVSNELGEVLGQAYPERGVLFAFEVAEDGQSSRLVSQIILEPLSAEPFVLRAETHLESQTRSSLLDLEQAIKLEPKNSRALWLHARVLAAGGELEKAVASIAEAVAITPDNPHYRVSRAQILGQTGKLLEAMQEAQQAVDLSANRPHVRARALCLLGDLSASGPKPDYRQALQFHTEAVKVADALTNDKHPAVRLAAKEVMVDAHLGAAHDIAWGDWKDKDVAVTRWLERAAAAADDLIANEAGTEEQRFRVCTRALGACVGVRGGIDPTVWTRAALHIGQGLIDGSRDPIRKAQLEWDLGMALYDALQTFQIRGDHASALKYGERAIAYLNGSPQAQSPATAYLLGRLYFRLGAIHSLQDQNHKAAIEWFNKAAPLLEKPMPAEAMADLGRHGETFVSMGVSYWEAGQRDRAVELTSHGVSLMEQAVKQGAMAETSLAVPYGNLSAMHRHMGSPDAAKRFQTMATRLRTTSTQ
jgi:tetratricopeptide (TPR) repeat protein